MKKTLITFFTIIFCLTSSVGYAQNIICEYTGYICPETEFKNLIIRDKIYFKKFTTIPFFGKVFGKEIGSMKNGKKEGSWVTYHDNGQLKSKGDFKNGIKINTWVYSDEKGLSTIGEYKEGKPDGSWINYNWINIYKEGILLSKNQQKDGQKNGSWIAYYDNKMIESQGQFKDGKEDGLWTYFHKNGQISSTGKYVYGKKEGYWEDSLKNGKFINNYSGIYKNGIKISD